MMDIKLLEEMAGRSIGETPPEDLKDILQVDIRGDTVCQKWEDYLARGGICAVEWSENVAEAIEDYYAP